MASNNSGISTLYTLHNLHKQQRAMNTSIERISSGYVPKIYDIGNESWTTGPTLTPSYNDYYFMV